MAIHEIVGEGKDIYLIFDLVAGRSLASIISQNNRIPFVAAVRIMRDACAAVAAAHGRGIIHRDLKPSNMMIDGTGAVCAQSDIYSLAVTLYEMLAGRRPFAGMGGAMTLKQAQHAL